MGWGTTPVEIASWKSGKNGWRPGDVDPKNWVFLVVNIGCDMWDPLVVLLRFVENVVRPRAPS